MLKIFKKQSLSTPPCWLMRQAGRYLPEYQKLRTQQKNFIKFCLTPDLITEATLQPLERYPLDAAIIFSDILLIPYALGQRVQFIQNRGPILDPITTVKELKTPDEVALDIVLSPVYEGLRHVKRALPKNKALIGFSGNPWTLACYMVDGGYVRSFTKTKLLALRRPDLFSQLINLLVRCIVQHIRLQIAAGAQVVQLFESWAETVPENFIGPWLIEPCAKIVKGVRETHPLIPIIAFPRGLRSSLKEYVETTAVDALSIDSMISIKDVLSATPSACVIQGALDPNVLVAGGDVLKSEVNRLICSLRGRAHIFNLGHGVLPETPPHHVGELLKYIHESPNANLRESLL
jgi:uroporphyrinogen decarboxylase